MADTTRQTFGAFSFESAQVEAAALEAAAIGGRAGDEHLDPSKRPLVEAGEGESEGFELAEQELIEAAEFGDPRMNPLDNAFTPETGPAPRPSTYGEADHEESAGVLESDR